MQRTLIRSATIISMDDRIGDLRVGDLLVENGRIAEVRPDIDLGSGATETEIVDGRRRIVIPGLINAHMHTWQTALRGYAANWTLLEYFRRMHAGLATLFGPDDIYIATLAGALNQINCGATTLVDWCHNNPTPDHTDAAVRGLIESGIRAARSSACWLAPWPIAPASSRWGSPFSVRTIRHLRCRCMISAWRGSLA